MSSNGAPRYVSDRSFPQEVAKKRRAFQRVAEDCEELLRLMPEEFGCEYLEELSAGYSQIDHALGAIIELLTRRRKRF